MKKILLTFLIISFFVSCKQNRGLKLVKFGGEAQGTYYAVTYYSETGEILQNQVDSILKGFNFYASLWEPNSTICKINRNDSLITLDSIFVDLFNKSISISKITEGNFDFTVGQLVNAWGFGFDGRTKLNKYKIDSLLKFVGYKNIEIKNGKIVKMNPNIKIDFNAIAQGYSVDILSKYLSDKGIENYLIDVGGEVMGKGKKPDGGLWTVGIEKPAENADSERILKAKIKLLGKAIATSGNYRKYYEENGIRYSHTIDPKTGYPVRHSLLSATVLADECWEADAYATAFMVMGLEKSLNFIKKTNKLEAFFIFTDESGNLKTFSTNGIKQLIEEIE